MEIATTSGRTLQIDGMTGDVCVQHVTDAIQSVPGVRIQSVTVGAATIECDQAACNAVCTAIDGKGFMARETARTGDAAAAAAERPTVIGPYKFAGTQS